MAQSLKSPLAGVTRVEIVLNYKRGFGVALLTAR